MTEHLEKEFIFVGEVMALDLINTLKMVRGKEQDLLQGPDDLAQWWEVARQHHPEIEVAEDEKPVFNQALFESVKALRDQLRQLFIGIIEGSAPETAKLEFLNAILHSTHPVIEWHGNTPHMHYVADDPTAQLLVSVALSAMHILTTGDLSRLRQCHSHHIHRCILLFYDTTKSGTRQWCSTACLDRERSARRYEEKKRASEG